MFSAVFIKRPIFASVISIVIVILGAISYDALPRARYPDIAPPTIQVSAFYPGASATTIGETVATPIEQEVNGVGGMLYMSSVSASDGSCSITVTFESGTNIDLAQVDVQNRLARATPRLPSAVTQQGVKVDKSRSNTLLFVMLSSTSGSSNAALMCTGPGSMESVATATQRATVERQYCGCRSRAASISTASRVNDPKIPLCAMT